MTAINIQSEKDRVTVWADGLNYYEDGTVHSVVHKTVKLGNWNAVIATTGMRYSGDLLAALLPTLAASFDDFLEHKEIYLRAAMSTVQRSLNESRSQRFAAFVAGWSDERNEPEVVVYNDLQATGEGDIYTTGGIVSPKLTEEEVVALSLTLGSEVRRTGRKPTMRWVVRETMEAQRRHRANPAFVSALGRDAARVGGHITETVVTAKGITENVVHRWDDTVGEKIKIEPHAIAPAHPAANLNRQQRRALARSAA